MKVKAAGESYCCLCCLLSVSRAAPFAGILEFCVSASSEAEHCNAGTSDPHGIADMCLYSRITAFRPGTVCARAHCHSFIPGRRA